MKRILVPLDGSDLAERALSPAVALASGHGAELHLLSVVSTLPPMAFVYEPLKRAWMQGEEVRLREYMDQTAPKVAARSNEFRVEAHVRVGRVGKAIRTVAEEFEADLVVLTTHGWGPFARAWLGSTADELVRMLERPILLLPATENARNPFAENQILHVMVPLDGSEAAEAALDALPLVFPASRGGRITLASVVEEGLPVPDVYLPHAISEAAFREDRRKSAAGYLATASQRVEDAGAGVPETRVLTARDAARGLLRFCGENEVDVMALSTHGRGGVPRLVVGSVADKLVRGAGIPLLITRRPSAQRP